MLDPQMFKYLWVVKSFVGCGSAMFKYLWVVKSFVGCGSAIHLTIKYDVQEIIPFFMKLFYWLNLMFEVVVAPCDENVVQIEEKHNKMFGVGAYMEEPYLF